MHSIARILPLILLLSACSNMRRSSEVYSGTASDSGIHIKAKRLPIDEDPPGTLLPDCQLDSFALLEVKEQLVGRGDEDVKSLLVRIRPCNDLTLGSCLLEARRTYELTFTWNVATRECEVSARPDDGLSEAVSCGPCPGRVVSVRPTTKLVEFSAFLDTAGTLQCVVRLGDQGMIVPMTRAERSPR